VDWVVNEATWNQIMPLIAGNRFTYELVGFQPDSDVDPPPLSACTIEQVVGRLEVNSLAGGFTNVAFGIYISEWDSATGAWQKQDPMDADDAARDNWIHHEARAYYAGVTNTTALNPSLFPVNIRPRVRLVGGQSLRFAITAAGLSVASSIVPLFRTRISRVV